MYSKFKRAMDDALERDRLVARTVSNMSLVSATLESYAIDVRRASHRLNSPAREEELLGMLLAIAAFCERSAVDLKLVDDVCHIEPIS